MSMSFNPLILAQAQRLIFSKDDEKKEALEKGIKDNNLDFVRAFISIDSPLHTHDRSLALRVCIEKNCLDLALEIIQMNDFESVELKTDSLLEACQKNQPEIVKALIAKGAVLSETEKTKAILNATFYQRSSILEIMLKNWPIDEKTKEQGVFFSVKNRNSNILSMFLETKVDLAQHIRSQSLIFASKNGDLKIVSLLYKNGPVNPESINSGFLAAINNDHLEVAIELFKTYQITDDTCNKALISASTRGNLAILKFLLEVGFFSKETLDNAIKTTEDKGDILTTTFLKKEAIITDPTECDKLLTSLTQKGLSKKIQDYRNQVIKQQLLKSLINIEDKTLLEQLPDITSNSEIAYGLSSIVLFSIIPPKTSAAGAASASISEGIKEETANLLMILEKFKEEFKDANRLKILLNFLIKVKTSPIEIDKKLCLIKNFLNPEFSLNELLDLLSLFPLAIQQLGSEELLSIPVFNQETVTKRLLTNLVDQGFLSTGLEKEFSDTFLTSRIPSAIFTYAAHFINDPVMKKTIHDFITLVSTKSLKDWRIMNNFHAKFLEKEQQELWEKPLDAIEFNIAKYENLEFSSKDFFFKNVLPLAQKNSFDFSILETCLKYNTPLPSTSSSLEKKIYNFCIASFEDRNKKLDDLLLELQETHPDSPLIKPFEDLKKTKKEVVIDSDDWQDLFLCGTEVVGSCLNVNGCADINKSLLGYALDGKTRILSVKDDPKGAIKARCVLKIFLQETRLSSGEKIMTPCLFLEPIYPKTASPAIEKQIKDMAKKKAASLGINLYEEGSDITLCSKGVCAPFEYEDAASTTTIISNGVLSISADLIYESHS